MANRSFFVLAHGIAPFDFWSPIVERILPGAAARWDYFKNIKPELEREGHDALATSVSFAGSLEQRARELGEQIRAGLSRTNHRKAHIIGHSMGGLDARCMIASDPEIAERVASLTTIGTPHNGTPVADFWHLTQRDSATSRALDSLRPILDLEGFKDLTTVACSERNRQWREAESRNAVYYQTYCSFEEKKGVFPPLRQAWQIIFDAGAGDEDRKSDGLVPLPSQRWQDAPKKIARRDFSFPADHLNQLAWWDIAEIEVGNWRPGRYEQQVRGVYLEIARTVSAM